MGSVTVPPQMAYMQAIERFECYLYPDMGRVKGTVWQMGCADVDSGTVWHPSHRLAS